MEINLDNEFAKINEVVRDFVKSISEEYDCRMGIEFCVYLEENMIEWSILYVENGGEAFYENFISRFPKARGFNLFTLSVLHEIGHLETEWDMEDETYLRNTDTMDDETYFNLYNEKIATDWAGEWIEDNFDEALAIDDKFNEILSKFFEKVLNKDENM